MWWLLKRQSFTQNVKLLWNPGYNISRVKSDRVYDEVSAGEDRPPKPSRSERSLYMWKPDLISNNDEARRHFCLTGGSNSSQTQELKTTVRRVIVLKIKASGERCAPQTTNCLHSRSWQHKARADLNMRGQWERNCLRLNSHTARSHFRTVM